MESHKFRKGLNNTCFAFTCTDKGKYSAIFVNLNDRCEKNECKFFSTNEIGDEIKNLNKSKRFRKNLVWIHYIGENKYLMFFEFVKIKKIREKTITKIENV